MMPLRTTMTRLPLSKPAPVVPVDGQLELGQQDAYKRHHQPLHLSIIW